MVVLPGQRIGPRPAGAEPAESPEARGQEPARHRFGVRAARTDVEQCPRQQETQQPARAVRDDLHSPHRRREPRRQDLTGLQEDTGRRQQIRHRQENARLTGARQLEDPRRAQSGRDSVERHHQHQQPRRPAAGLGDRGTERAQTRQQQHVSRQRKVRGLDLRDRDTAQRDRQQRERILDDHQRQSLNQSPARLPQQQTQGIDARHPQQAERVFLFLLGDRAGEGPDPDQRQNDQIQPQNGSEERQPRSSHPAPDGHHLNLKHRQVDRHDQSQPRQMRSPGPDIHPQRAAEQGEHTGIHRNPAFLSQSRQRSATYTTRVGRKRSTRRTDFQSVRHCRTDWKSVLRHWSDPGL